MHRGSLLATGEWLLFTDADVHFAPGTIRRAIACCLQRDLDHLAAFPAIESAGFWLDVAIAGFIRLFFLGIRPWAVEDPRSAPRSASARSTWSAARPWRERKASNGSSWNWAMMSPLGCFSSAAVPAAAS